MKPLNHEDWELLVHSRFPGDGRDVDFVDEAARQEYLEGLVRNLIEVEGRDPSDIIEHFVGQSRKCLRRSMSV